MVGASCVECQKIVPGISIPQERGERKRLANKNPSRPRKVVAARPDISPSAADVLKEPVVVCRASGTCVVKKEDQRIPESR